jgi:endonuclease-3
VEIRNKIAETEKILLRRYGESSIAGKRPLPVLDEMILTILSQNTNDRNSGRAFDNLKSHFPTAEELSRADQETLSDVIKTGGLGRIKAGYILALLKWLETNYGTLDCGFICNMETDEALRTFRDVKGIGVKTIAVTLAFACERDIFPVDTHVFRVMKRIGNLPESKTPEKAFYFLKELIPQGKGISMHMNVIRHGREVCHPRKPDCPNCILNKICDYFLSESETRSGAPPRASSSRKT